jgi:hypothetical protein
VVDENIGKIVPPAEKKGAAADSSEVTPSNFTTVYTPTQQVMQISKQTVANVAIQPAASTDELLGRSPQYNTPMCCKACVYFIHDQISLQQTCLRLHAWLVGSNADPQPVAVAALSAAAEHIGFPLQS